MARPFAIALNRQTCCLFLLCAAATVFCGCSGQNLGPTGSVSGTLTYNGEPVAEGTTVVFMNTTTGHSCFGDTDSEGNYALTSWNDGQLPVGKYDVTIRPPAPEVDPETIDADELMDNPELTEKMKVQFDFPKRYGQIATSGLSFEVKEGENEYQIDLKD